MQCNAVTKGHLAQRCLVLLHLALVHLADEGRARVRPGAREALWT